MGNNKKAMTPEAQARIHSTEAKQGGGCVSKGSFTARAQRTVAQQTKTKKHGCLLSKKDDDDNRSRQLNPEHDAYWQSRGYDKRPADEE